mgnify:CR=1 FL=1
MQMTTVVLAGAALVAYLAIMISIPLRTKKVRQNAGTLQAPLKNATSAKWVLIAVFSLAVIVIIPFRDMGLFVNVILFFTAICSFTICRKKIV